MSACESDCAIVDGNIMKARVVLQQCLSSKLRIQCSEESNKFEEVEMNRGLIVFICFMKNATKETVDKIVKSVLSVKLSEDEGGKRVSVKELPGDVLIIPQATLGGTVKGKAMQYHRNISKEEGKELYEYFVEQCIEILTKEPKFMEMNKVVRSGTYGNRQVFSTVTNGPFTHLLDF